jgi:hypothetical protein
MTKHLVSLPPEFIVISSDGKTETCGTLPSIQRARDYAESMARLNKGITFHIYQVNRPTFYKESCRLNQVQWFVDPTIEEEE